MDRGAWEATVHGVTKSWTRFSDYTATQVPFAHFLKSFSTINRHWILSIIFLCLLKWLYCFYSLLYSCVSYWFVDIEKNLCILKINSTWSWCMILLMSCWIQFSTFLRISVFTFFSNTDLYFTFCVGYLCPVLVSGWWWPHRMSSEVFLPLQFLNLILQDNSSYFTTISTFGIVNLLNFGHSSGYIVASQ